MYILVLMYSPFVFLCKIKMFSMFYNTLRVSKFQTALVLKLSLNRFFCYQISFKALINIFTCYLSLKTA